MKVDLLSCRLKLPFLVETYEPDCDHSISCILDPTLLTSEPILICLRVHYHVSLSGSVTGLIEAFDSGCRQYFNDEKLSLPAQDVKSLKCLHQAMSIEEVAPLMSHEAVFKTLHLANIKIASNQLSNKNIPQWKKLLDK